SGLEKIDQIKFNGDLKSQLPNIINISFFKAEGESILMMLDMEDIYVSTGSACSSGTLQPSHVLTAMGVSPEWSHGSIRISLGRFNSLEEVDIFLQKINPIIKKLRKMAP
ncbi:MAG TPA: aminotransferase class V-fold PLP-dependent enzyme, partial [Patescibacteria group bacterium]|nr:aminotransferase class V-fold PLP-dependent enzyme [Patescibacteria group bacterium]